MPLISYPKAAYDEAVKMAEHLANAEPHMMDWQTAEIGGFFTGLRCCLPSEAVGWVVMAHDDALEQFRRARDATDSLTGAPPNPLSDAE